MASYERQTWVDLQTPLDAAHMNHIEEGIASIVGITSIKQTTTSTADGGNNVITATLDNGTTETFNIKNGSKGSTGSKGDTGAAGVGIKSVVQTTTSSADGGSNVITVTKTDGTKSTFTVRNGSKGSAGAAGAKGVDGYTPVKGVDYWTPADQESIVQQVIAALGTPVFGTIDENNHITLSGHLVGGTYTLGFEDEDGFEADVGTINKSSGPNYTNVIPMSTDVNGNPYNGGLGYKVGYRYSSSGGGDKADDGLSATGYIQCKDTDTLYFKNVGMNKNAGVPNGCNVYKFNTLSATSSESGDATIMTNYYSAQWDSSGNIVSMTCGNNPTGATVWMRFNTTYLGPDSIITLNQPITD